MVVPWVYKEERETERKKNYKKDINYSKTLKVDRINHLSGEYMRATY